MGRQAAQEVSLTGVSRNVFYALQSRCRLAITVQPGIHNTFWQVAFVGTVPPIPEGFAPHVFDPAAQQLSMVSG